MQHLLLQDTDVHNRTVNIDEYTNYAKGWAPDKPQSKKGVYDQKKELDFIPKVLPRISHMPADALLNEPKCNQKLLYDMRSSRDSF